jgi:hypothetical protein
VWFPAHPFLPTLYTGDQINPVNSGCTGFSIDKERPRYEKWDCLVV